MNETAGPGWLIEFGESFIVRGATPPAFEKEGENAPLSTVRSEIRPEKVCFSHERIIPGGGNA